MAGVKGQRWYHRYHQSYSSKPTRSGKVGQEHFRMDSILKEVKNENKNINKDIHEVKKRYKAGLIDRDSYNNILYDLKNDSRINKSYKKLINKESYRQHINNLLGKNGYRVMNDAWKHGGLISTKRLKNKTGYISSEKLEENYRKMIKASK